MNIFLDTSSLFKLYHQEKDTELLMDIFKNNSIDKIYLSEITKIEFDSVVWKKYRKKEIDENKVAILIQNFDKDSLKFHFIPDNRKVRKSAKELITKHRKIGLRTLDSIQLASTISIKNKTKLFLTSDYLLQNLFEMEGLKIML
ncbi:MAG: type II toxin-antitoxin system VapC family toxin [Bacteroidota bacterium]